MAFQPLSPAHLLFHVVSAMNETKAISINILDISEITDIAKYFVIASARSDRHAQGVADRVMEVIKRNSKIKPDSVEGFDTGHWILIDYADVVVHIFYQPVRERYDLDSLWGRGRAVSVEDVLCSGLDAA